MNCKNQILELRQQGKSYNEIKSILGCSKGSISYHCGEGQKQKNRNRQQKRRNKQHFLQDKYERFIYSKKKNISKQPKLSVKIERVLYYKMHDFIEKVTDDTFTLQQLIDKIINNPKCYLTGQNIDFNQPKTYEFDHIIPRSRGGNNSLENLGLCTKEVNRAKNNMTAEEFINLCKLVVNNNL